MSMQFNPYTKIIKTKNLRRTILQGMISKRTDQPTTPRSIHPLVMPHAYSSYGQLDYHTSWSLLGQHSRIRELDSQTA